MFKELDGFTRTYAVSEKYRVDVQMVDVDEPDECYEAWLYNKSLGVKMFMFGAPTNQQDYYEFLLMVTNEWSEYVDSYKEHCKVC